MSAYRLESFLAQQRWQAFQSVETAKIIPPFAPVQLGSASSNSQATLDEQTGEYLLLAGQVRFIHRDIGGSNPGTCVSCDDIAFNGPMEVLPGERGILTFDTPCIARYSDSTTGLLTPENLNTSALGGWDLQNVLPSTGEPVCVPSCFRRLGFIEIAGRSFATVQRIRYSAFFQDQKLLS